MTLQNEEKELLDAINGKDYDSVELLLQKGVNPNTKFTVLSYYGKPFTLITNLLLVQFMSIKKKLRY